MIHLETRTPRSKRPLVLTLLVIVTVVLLAGGFYLAPRFESQAPVIILTPDSDVVGKAPIEIGVTDQGTGLKSITATLSAAGTEHPVSTEIFATPTREKKLSVEVAKLAGIKEGPAVLRVVARDGSLFTGNETVLQKEITIDITPPTLQLIAEDRYINFGGAGAIVYKPSADTATSAGADGPQSQCRCSELARFEDVGNPVPRSSVPVRQMRRNQLTRDRTGPVASPGRR